MVARALLLLTVFGLTLQLTTAVAVQPAALIRIDNTSFTQGVETGSLVCEVATSIEAGLIPGKTGNVVISFSSMLSSSTTGENIKAVILNGLVAVAFPPGLEFAGDSKMQFFNPATGQYELMYSGSYPDNPLTGDLAAAMSDASASNPGQIIRGLRAVCEKLAPGSGFSAPGDPRINGADPAYSVAGKSWLVPVSLMQNEVVNPFDLKDSIASEARLSISFPFRVTGEISGMPVVVYAGGLSTGVAQVDLLPAEIPLGALPLSTVPQAVAGDAIPEPIPTLVYSHQWITWESEFLLADYLNAPQMPVPDPDRFAFPEQGGTNTPGLPASTSPEPAPRPNPSTPVTEPQPVVKTEIPPAAIPPPINVPKDSASEPEVDSFKLPFIGLDSGEKPLPNPQPPYAVEPTQPAQVAQQNIPAQQPAPAALPALQQPASVLEVELGTIPEQDSNFRVPLKQITGSAQGQIQPLQQAGVGSDLGGGPAFLDEMVFVDEGYFLMGTSNLSSAGDQDELPQTSVYLPDYYIDKYPVTNRKFYEFVIDAGYKPQGKWDKYYSKGTADLPVRGVTWNDANEFAQWAGKRLPTEAEWEKACRGVDGRLYPWGDNWSSDILPRGELIYDIMHAPDAVSPYGAMAMVGVFWQWTASQFALYPYDPNAVSDEYVLRGGCFSNGRNIVRCANRYSQPPNVALNTFGFRCATDSQ